MFLNKGVFLLLFIGAVSGSFAQDLEKDFNSVAQKLDSSKAVAINAKITAYDKKGGARMFNSNASVRKNEKASHTVMADQEYYNDGTYQVEVDHENKSVSVIKIDKGYDKGELSVDMKALRKMLLPEKEAPKQITKLIANNKGIKTYSITNIPSVKEIVVSLNMNTFSVARVTYEYADKSEYQGQYIVIDYTRFDADASVSEDLKSTNFFTVKEGKVVLNNRFKGYKLYTT